MYVESLFVVCVGAVYMYEVWVRLAGNSVGVDSAFVLAVDSGRSPS